MLSVYCKKEFMKEEGIVEYEKLQYKELTVMIQDAPIKLAQSDILSCEESYIP